ncbi:MAG: hypothetical protein EAZ59_04135 [Oscillatoriales cyanobacterium]|nr:MAG: hypothetical protein EAZ59_04135 [Oscillatoriales cyanobacterium]
MTNIIDRFSTYYQVNSHPHAVHDCRLRQNLRRLLQQHPELNDETVLLKYFCNQAAKNNSNSLAKYHLLAYVDVACYSAAKSTYDAFQTPDLILADYLQIARSYMANRAVELCTKFDRTKSQIETYLYRPLRDAIMSEVRKNEPTQRQSDWGLLRRSEKCFTEFRNFRATIIPLLPNLARFFRSLCPSYSRNKSAITGAKGGTMGGDRPILHRTTITEFCNAIHSAESHSIVANLSHSI